jgi:hypothetical protein
MIEANEYVRTKDGKIGIFDRHSSRKENSLYKSPFNCFIKIKNRKTPLQCCEDYIVKHSKQPIDLIEVGDIVNKELVIGIIDITNDKEEIIGRKLITQYRSAQFTGLDIKHYIYVNDIKTILTKESYMANCYKVGGEDE